MTTAKHPSNTVPAAALTAPPVRLDSALLFKGAAEIEIHHLGAVYRLRATKFGKLILTK